jgi:hypothetical protein
VHLGTPSLDCTATTIRTRIGSAILPASDFRGCRIGRSRIQACYPDLSVARFRDLGELAIGALLLPKVSLELAGNILAPISVASASSLWET